MTKVQLGQVPGLVCIECGLNPQLLRELVVAAQAASNLLYSQHENNRMGHENEVLDTVQAVDAAVDAFSRITRGSKIDSKCTRKPIDSKV